MNVIPFKRPADDAAPKRSPGFIKDLIMYSNAFSDDPILIAIHPGDAPPLVFTFSGSDAPKVALWFLMKRYSLDHRDFAEALDQSPAIALMTTHFNGKFHLDNLVDSLEGLGLEVNIGIQGVGSEFADMLDH